MKTENRRKGKSRNLQETDGAEYAAGRAVNCAVLPKHSGTEGNKYDRHKAQQRRIGKNTGGRGTAFRGWEYR